MKYLLITVFCLLVVLSCKQPGTDETASDTLLVEADTGMVAVDETDAMRDIIDYYGSFDTDAEMSLATLAPLEEVLTAARGAIYFKDSLGRDPNRSELTNAADSALFKPSSDKAYAAILAYQQAMKSGIKLNDRVPKLTDIVRTPGASDKTSELLPPAGNSNYLSQGNFFFLGGAPFIDQNEGTFAGPDGRAEVHYGTSYTENTNFLFNSVFHQFPGAMEVTFGPGLESYEGAYREVNGIGSLMHTFANRIPAYFITEQGPVKASLISVRIKLVPQSMGCISDEPYYTFACSENVDSTEILGIYIPYKQSTLDKQMTVDRMNSSVWTADLNGDGLADITCVAGVFEGISSDTMSEVLWFMNIGGEWKILDYGSDPDCT